MLRKSYSYNGLNGSGDPPTEPEPVKHSNGQEPNNEQSSRPPSVPGNSKSGSYPPTTMRQHYGQGEDNSNGGNDYEYDYDPPPASLYSSDGYARAPIDQSSSDLRRKPPANMRAAAASAAAAAAPIFEMSAALRASLRHNLGSSSDNLNIPSGLAAERNGTRKVQRVGSFGSLKSFQSNSSKHSFQSNYSKKEGDGSNEFRGLIQRRPSLKSLRSCNSRRSFQSGGPKECDGSARLQELIQNKRGSGTGGYADDASISSSNSSSTSSSEEHSDGDSTLESSFVQSPFTPVGGKKKTTVLSSASMLDAIQEEKERFALMIAQLEAENHEIEEKIQLVARNNERIRKNPKKAVHDNDDGSNDGLGSPSVKNNHDLASIVAQLEAETIEIEQKLTLQKSSHGEMVHRHPFHSPNSTSTDPKPSTEYKRFLKPSAAHLPVNEKPAKIVRRSPTKSPRRPFSKGADMAKFVAHLESGVRGLSISADSSGGKVTDDKVPMNRKIAPSSGLHRTTTSSSTTANQEMSDDSSDDSDSWSSTTEPSPSQSENDERVSPFQQQYPAPFAQQQPPYCTKYGQDSPTEARSNENKHQQPNRRELEQQASLQALQLQQQHQKQQEAQEWHGSPTEARCTGYTNRQPNGRELEQQDARRGPEQHQQQNLPSQHIYQKTTEPGQDSPSSNVQQNAHYDLHQRLRAESPPKMHEEDAATWMLKQIENKNAEMGQIDQGHGVTENDSCAGKSESTWTLYTIKTNKTGMSASRDEISQSEYLPRWSTHLVDDGSSLPILETSHDKKCRGAVAPNSSRPHGHPNGRSAMPSLEESLVGRSKDGSSANMRQNQADPPECGGHDIMPPRDISPLPGLSTPRNALPHRIKHQVQHYIDPPLTSHTDADEEVSIDIFPEAEKSGGISKAIPKDISFSSTEHFSDDVSPITRIKGRKPAIRSTGSTKAETAGTNPNTSNSESDSSSETADEADLFLDFDEADNATSPSSSSDDSSISLSEDDASVAPTAETDDESAMKVSKEKKRKEKKTFDTVSMSSRAGSEDSTKVDERKDCNEEEPKAKGGKVKKKKSINKGVTKQKTEKKSPKKETNIGQKVDSKAKKMMSTSTSREERIERRAKERLLNKEQSERSSSRSRSVKVEDEPKTTRRSRSTEKLKSVLSEKENAVRHSLDTAISGGTVKEDRTTIVAAILKRARIGQKVLSRESRSLSQDRCLITEEVSSSIPVRRARSKDRVSVEQEGSTKPKRLARSKDRSIVGEVPSKEATRSKSQEKSIIDRRTSKSRGSSVESIGKGRAKSKSLIKSDEDRSVDPKKRIRSKSRDSKVTKDTTPETMPTESNSRRFFKKEEKGIRKQKSAEDILKQLQEEKARKKEKTRSLRNAGSLSPSRNLKNADFGEIHTERSPNNSDSNPSVSSADPVVQSKQSKAGMSKYFERSRKKDYLSFSVH